MTARRAIHGAAPRHGSYARPYGLYRATGIGSSLWAVGQDAHADS